MPSDLGIDWVQMTTPAGNDSRVLEACHRAAGGEVPRVGRGRRVPGGEPYAQGRYWPGGIEFHSGGRDRSWLIVRGTACGRLGFSEVREFMRTAMFGATVTRIDIRRDERGEGLRLVHDVNDACHAGQLRQVREFTPYPKQSADLEVLGMGVLLGSYASPKCVRVYDKGLESGTLPEGQWVRFEAELTGEVAHKAACEVFGGESLEACRVSAMRVLHGIVDFRVGPRGQGVNVSRLPRPGWWEEFLGGCEGLRLSETVLPADLDRWCNAFQIQYGNVLVEAARSAGMSAASLFELVMCGASPTAGTRDNPIVGLLAGAFAGTIRDG